LSPLDFLKIKEDLLDDHVHNTAEWFFNNDAFLAWYERDRNQVTLCGRTNGAGKSILASLAANYRMSITAVKIAVLFAYYDLKSPDQQRCADIIAGMLKQFLSSS
ncbi:hypothetical protein B0J13DRAFT_401067, partial [Dactylonectria estremocensis]